MSQAEIAAKNSDGDANANAEGFPDVKQSNEEGRLPSSSKKPTFEERLLRIQQKRKQSQQYQSSIDSQGRSSIREMVMASGPERLSVKPDWKMQADREGPQTLALPSSNQGPTQNKGTRARNQLSFQERNYPSKQKVEQANCTSLNRETRRNIEMKKPIARKTLTTSSSSDLQLQFNYGKMMKIPSTVKTSKKRPPLTQSKDYLLPKRPLHVRQDCLVQEYISRMSHRQNSQKLIKPQDKKPQNHAQLGLARASQGMRSPSKKTNRYEENDQIKELRVLSSSSSPPLPQSDHPKPIQKSLDDEGEVRLEGPRNGGKNASPDIQQKDFSSVPHSIQRNKAKAERRQMNSRSRRFTIETNSDLMYHQKPRNTVQNTSSGSDVMRSRSRQDVKNPAIKQHENAMKYMTDSIRSSARQQQTPSSRLAPFSQKDLMKSLEDQEFLDLEAQTGYGDKCELSFEKSERNDIHNRRFESGPKILEALKEPTSKDIKVISTKEFIYQNKISMPLGGEFTSRAAMNQGNIYHNSTNEKNDSGQLLNTTNPPKNMRQSSRPKVYSEIKNQNFSSDKKRPEIMRSFKQGSEEGSGSQPRSYGLNMSSRKSFQTQLTGMNSSKLAQQRYSSCQYDSLSWLNKYPKQVKPNSNSEKIILRRFNKDFTKILLEILNKNKKDGFQLLELPKYIKFDAFRCLIDQMVFFKKRQDQPNAAEGASSPSKLEAQSSEAQPQQGSISSGEHKLIKEMWQFLIICRNIEVLQKQTKVSEQHSQSVEDDQQNEASVGDIKVILMAIFQIKGNKRMGITPPSRILDQEILSDGQQSLLHKNHLAFGWINDQEQLCLSDADIQRIQAKFGSLNAMRMFNQGKRQTEKKKNISQEQDVKYTFKPARVDSRGASNTSRQNIARSSSRQDRLAQTSRRHGTARSRERASSKASPRPQDPKNRGKDFSESLETLRCSQQTVKQKLLEKYFKKDAATHAKPPQTTMRKLPAHANGDLTSARGGVLTSRSGNMSQPRASARLPERKQNDKIVKKTEITLSSLNREKQAKANQRSRDQVEKSPHGQLYLLDKNFRSFNSHSQRQLHSRSTNLLDKLCSSYNNEKMNEKLRIAAEAQQEEPAGAEAYREAQIQPSIPTKEESEPEVADRSRQPEGLQKQQDTHKTSRRDESPLALKSQTSSKNMLEKTNKPYQETANNIVQKHGIVDQQLSKSAIKEELELLKNRQRLPSIVEATRETPSICHTVPSPCQQPNKVDEYATIDSKTDEFNSFEQIKDDDQDKANDQANDEDEDIEDKAEQNLIQDSNKPVKVPAYAPKKESIRDSFVKYKESINQAKDQSKLTGEKKDDQSKAEDRENEEIPESNRMSDAKASDGNKRECPVQKLISKQNNAKTSDQRFEETKKAVEELFRYHQQLKQSFGRDSMPSFKDEARQESKEQPQLPDQRLGSQNQQQLLQQPEMLVGQPEAASRQEQQNALSHQVSSNQQSLKSPQIEEVTPRNHQIILKTKSGQNSTKSGHRSPISDKNLSHLSQGSNIKSIIQQSLSSVRNLTQNSGPNSAALSPNAAPKIQIATLKSVSSIMKKSPQTQDAKTKKQQMQSSAKEPSEGELTRKTVRIDIVPNFRSSSPLNLRKTKDSEKEAQADEYKPLGINKKLESQTLGYSFSKQQIQDRQSMVKNLMKDYDDYHDSMHSQLSSIKKVLKSNKKQQ